MSSTPPQLVTVMLLIPLAGAARAQTLPPLVMDHQARTVQGQGSAAGSVVFGALLGGAGFGLGGLIGALASSNCTSFEYCQLEGLFYGAAAGGTFGMALGVHLGNHRRGNLGLDFLTGAGIWGAGIAVVALSENEAVTTATLIAIPIVQLVSTVLVERLVGRSRARRGAVTLAVGPCVRRGPGLIASLRF